MKRRTHTARPPLLAATAVLLLLSLTACGGSGGSDDEIEGVEEGGNEEQQSETPTEEASEGGVDRPEIVLPDSFENIFEGWESDDPKEQAVLDDAREGRNAVDLAILERAPEADYVTFYHSAEALASTVDWVEGFIENDRTIEGTVRYLDPVVALQGENAASVMYCGDESDATAVDVGTGEAIPDESGEPQVSYATFLERNDQGVWVTTGITSEREECA